MARNTILIDFDRTLHMTSKFNESHVVPDPPIDGAIDFLESLVEAGFEPVIFTARLAQKTDEEREVIVHAIRTWLKIHGFSLAEQILITCEKLPSHVIIDDRAIPFKGKYPSIESIINFRSWIGKD